MQLDTLCYVINIQNNQTKQAIVPEPLYVAHADQMPSILQQHGFGKGVRTVKFFGTSDTNQDLVFRIPKALANVDAITRDRISVLVCSDGIPMLLRPRDNTTLYVGDRAIIMSVLGVYPLYALCQRRGIIDKAVLLLTVA